MLYCGAYRSLHCLVHAPSDLDVEHMLTARFFMCRNATSPQSSSQMTLSPPDTANARLAAPRSAPSGIAQQLRKSSEQHQHVQVPPPQEQHTDTMNLDDFIFPSSVGSPAGLSPEPSNDTPGPFNATAPSIPIRKPNLASDHNLSLARASAPSVPPAIHRENEFGYVARHVRKTSIDERRVCSSSCLRTMHLH